MDTKEALKQKVISKYEEWKADFEKLEAETKGAYAEGQLEGSKEAKDIELRMEEAKSLISKIQNANDEDVEELKATVNKQLAGFEEVFKKLKNRFN